MEKIKIGKVSGAQGLLGEIKLYHDSGDEEAIRRLTSLFLYAGDAETEAETTYAIENLRMHKRTPIVKLAGVEDRNMAEALVGCVVYALLEEARPDEENAWLVSDLIGLSVRFVGSDASLGRIKSVIDNPAHDILEIETEKGIRLLPLVDVFIRNVDVSGGFMFITPPEGWLG